MCIVFVVTDLCVFFCGACLVCLICSYLCLPAFPEQDEESGVRCGQGQGRPGGAGQQGAEGDRHHRAGQSSLP